MIAKYIPSITTQPVADPGAAPLYGQIAQTLGHVANIAAQDAQYREQAQNQINKSTLETNTIDKMNELYEQAKENPDADAALESFKAGAIAYKNGILERTPEGGKQLVTNFMNHSILTTGLKLKERAYQQNVSLATATFKENISTLSNQMQNNFMDGNQAGGYALQASINQKVNDGLKNTFITASQAALLTTANNKVAATYDVLGQYKAQRKLEAESLAKGEDVDYTGDFKKSLDSKLKPYLSKGWLSPADVSIIKNKMAAMDKEDAAAHGINKQNLNEILKQASFQAVNNGIAVSPEMEMYIKEAAPDKYNDFVQQQYLDLEQHSLVQKGTAGTLGQVQSDINSLNNSAANTSNLKRHNMLLAASYNLKNWVTNFNKDPAEALSNTDQTKQAIQNAQLSAPYLATKNIEDPQQQQRAQEQILQNAQYKSIAQQSVQKGIKPDDVKILTNAEVNKIAGGLNTLPQPDQANALQGELNSIPSEYRDQARRQLQKSIPTASPYMSRIMASDKYNQYTNQAAIGMNWSASDYKGALENKNLTPQKFEAIVRNSDSAQQMLNVTSQQAGNFMTSHNDFVKQQSRIAASLMNSNYNMDESTAIDTAGKMLSSGLSFSSHDGFNYFYPTSIAITKKMNGVTTTTESNIDNGRLKQAMDWMKESALNNINNVNLKQNQFINLPDNVRGTEGGALTVSLGGFIPNKNRDGLVLVDQGGEPITFGVNKESVEIKYKDIADPNSEFNKQLTAHLVDKSNKFFSNLELKPSELSQKLRENADSFALGSPYDRAVAGQQLKALANSVPGAAWDAITWPWQLAKAGGKGLAHLLERRAAEVPK